MEESNHTQSTLSRSNSRTSSNSELEKEIGDLDISSSGGSGNNIAGSGGNVNNVGNNKNLQIKKRISSSRTPTRKARRVRFYRNGDRFYTGIVLAVSNERYRYTIYKQINH